MSLKASIAPGLHRLALLTGMSATKARSQKAGRILSFHGVGDESYPAEIFEAHLHWLARHFSIVSLTTLLERLASPAGLTDELVLTLDDGLRNNFTSAYPVLKKLAAPATFFVCPGLAGTGRWLWTHEARARLAALPRPQRGELFSGKSPENEEQLMERMKSLTMPDRVAVEKKLRRLTADFKPLPAQRQRYDLMGWDELAALDAKLITIGSHSLTHPILSTLTTGDLICEMAESRRLLERKLNRPVEFFCYPNGSHNAEVVRQATAHYRAAVTTRPDFVRPGCDLHQLPRIGVAAKLPMLAWRMHRPGA